MAAAEQDGPEGVHPVDWHIGRRIRLARRHRHMRQKDLAGRLGISFQAVQKYEVGQNRVAASRLYEIARVLMVPVAFFFEGCDGAYGSRRPD